MKRVTYKKGGVYGSLSHVLIINPSRFYQAIHYFQVLQQTEYVHTA